MTELSLFTAMIGLVGLSDFIELSGLRVDTVVWGASVNLVDLDAVVDGVFFDVIVFNF